MVAIIRRGNKEYYVSAVFGFYDDNSEDHGLGRYFIVFNEEKNKLIKQYMFNSEKRPYFDKMVLLIDENQSDWNLDDNGYGCVNFLNKNEIMQYISEKEMPDELLKKCREIDTKVNYSEYNEIKNEADVEKFMLVSGGFHDARILEICEMEKETLKVVFDGLWGCSIEVFFKENVSYCTESRNPEKYDPYWLGASMFFDNGMIVFADDEDVKLNDINDNYCWFKAKQVIYHVIPE